jgi:F0F1-type ATP synthase assembly protein I
LHLDAELLKKTGVFALVSSELIACIGGGYWLGSFLDNRWESAPIFTVILATLGLTYAVWRIHKLSKQWLKKET